MKKMSKKTILKRMNYLVGHLAGVTKMIQKNRYCIDIIRQNQAVMAALQKVNEMILRNHLETCVKRAVENRDKKEQNKVFNEIIDVFQERL